MDGWFNVEEIDRDTFAISEYQHWEETHCYLVCGSEIAVLIDTGLGVSNIRNVVDELTDLPVAVVTTHAHWDHIGSHKHFENIAVHENEKAWLEGNFPLPLQMVKRNLMLRPCDFPKEFILDDYRIYSGTPQRILRDGSTLTLGNRRLEVIHTPGHSPGHCCFYERERKYLYSGDLIYCGCLDAFYPTTDPHLFLRSVQRIMPLEISRILPGHHRLAVPTDIIGKIEAAFSSLSDSGKLSHGSGVFDFGDFSIHL